MTLTESPQYIQITPIYQEQQASDNPSKALHTVSPSTATTTYVVPIGRKELATTWWKHCPNRCNAHHINLPSSSSRNDKTNRPCEQYCKPLRKNVLFLSKQMITIEQDQSFGGRSNYNNKQSFRLSRHERALQKNQGHLIHIISHVNNNSYNQAGSLPTSHQQCHYDLRIGNDVSHPWMQFRVSMLQPSSLIATTKTSLTAPLRTKRKLVLNEDENVSQCYTQGPSGTASNHSRKYLKRDPGTPRICTGVESIQSKQGPTICNSDEESIIADDGDHLLSTQHEQPPPVETQLATIIPNYASVRHPIVTPDMALMSDQNKSFTQVEAASSFKVSSPSQRRLFSYSPIEARFQRTCNTKDGQKSLHNDNFSHLSDDKSNAKSNHKVNKSIDCNISAAVRESTSPTSDASTYLSMPLPGDSDTESSPVDNNICNNKLQINSKTIHKYEYSSSVQNIADIVGSRTTVVNLSLSDWMKMKQSAKPKSKFQEAMIELVLLRNKNPSDDELVGIPSLIHPNTTLSSSMKFIIDNE